MFCTMLPCLAINGTPTTYKGIYEIFLLILWNKHTDWSCLVFAAFGGNYQVKPLEPSLLRF